MDKYIYVYIFEKYYAFTMITFILHFFFFFLFRSSFEVSWEI